MARIVTIGWNDGSAKEITFDAFGTAASERFFLDFIPSGDVYDNRRYNIPGVDGNFLIRAGFRGRTVAVTVRYQATLLTTCTANWKADREAFARYSCAVDDGQTYYTRCTLRPDSGQRASGEKNGALFDVRYVWDVEEL